MHAETISIHSAELQLKSEGFPKSTVRPQVDSDGVTVMAAPKADMFRDPAGSDSPPDAERFMATVEGDFQFSAHVEVSFHAQFDLGVLLGYVDDDNWFKICAELDPDGTRRVVSVVTRDGASDDANGWEIGDGGIHLRISRMAHAFALHASRDGHTWSMIRYFSLRTNTPAALKVGLLAQSPAGEGTRVRFSMIRMSRIMLAGVRSGA